MDIQNWKVPWKDHQRGVGSSGTLATSSLQSFLCIVLVEHIQAHALMFPLFLYGCSPTARAELNSWNKDNMNYMPSKPKSLTLWPSTEQVCWPRSKPLRICPPGNQGSEEGKDLKRYTAKSWSQAPWLLSCCCASCLLAWSERDHGNTRESACHLCFENQSRSAVDQQIDQYCHGGNHFLEVRINTGMMRGRAHPSSARVSWRSYSLMLSVLQPVNQWVGRGHASLGPSSMWRTWLGSVSGDQVWTFLKEKAGGENHFHRLFASESLPIDCRLFFHFVECPIWSTSLTPSNSLIRWEAVVTLVLQRRRRKLGAVNWPGQGHEPSGGAKAWMRSVRFQRKEACVRDEGRPLA